MSDVDELAKLVEHFFTRILDLIATSNDHAGGVQNQIGQMIELLGAVKQIIGELNDRFDNLETRLTKLEEHLQMKNTRH